MPKKLSRRASPSYLRTLRCLKARFVDQAVLPSGDLKAWIKHAMAFDNWTAEQTWNALRRDRVLTCDHGRLTHTCRIHRAVIDAILSERQSVPA